MYSGATGGHKKPPTGGEEYISDTVMVACVVLERALFIVHYLHHTLCKTRIEKKILKPNTASNFQARKMFIEGS